MPLGVGNVDQGTQVSIYEVNAHRAKSGDRREYIDAIFMHISSPFL